MIPEVRPRVFLTICCHTQAIIYSLTSVPPERQKIIGLVKGKIPGDETCLYVPPPSPHTPD